MFKRLAHLKTTIPAVIIAAVVGVLIYTDKATLTEASIALPAIIGLLGYKPRSNGEPLQ